MEQMLQDLAGVVGVRGAFVYADKGGLLASTLSEGFDPARLPEVGKTFTRTFEALKAARRRKVHELDLMYAEGRLVVKNLGAACLVVLCVPNINVPLLNLTANVVARRLQESLKAREATPLERKLTGAQPAPVSEAPVLEVVPSSAIEQAGLDIVLRARAEKVSLRLMGEMAIRLRCPALAAAEPAPSQEEGVLELAGRTAQARQIEILLAALGYIPDRRFNALFGHDRLRYAHPETRQLLEIYLDGVQSFHRLEFGDRLHLDEYTLPPTELLLSQLQNVKGEERELRRICGLLGRFDLGGASQPGVIDPLVIVELCVGDWGWYKTTTMNLEKCMSLAPQVLESGEAEVTIKRARRLMQMIEEAPKSLRWQLRARLGESRKWYEEPE